MTAYYEPPEPHERAGTVFDPTDPTFGPILAAIQAGDFEAACDRLAAAIVPVETWQRENRHPDYRAQVRTTLRSLSDEALAFQSARIVRGIDREECDRELTRRAAAPTASERIRAARGIGHVLAAGHDPRACPECAQRQLTDAGKRIGLVLDGLEAAGTLDAEHGSLIGDAIRETLDSLDTAIDELGQARAYPDNTPAGEREP